MNERQLLAFTNVLRHGTMTKAAELMHVTQSAVSQMITSLEEDLGFPVFDRRQGKITATPQGRSFLATAEDVLASIEKARRDATELRNLSVGNFRIAATSVFAMALVPKALARFSDRHPDVTTSLQAHHSRDIREMVDSAIFDVGVCEVSAGELHGDGASYTLDCALLCHRDDPLAAKEVVTPQDLWQRTVVTLYDRHPTAFTVREALLDSEIAWKSHIECNLFTVALQLVLHGGAVGWIDPFTFAMFDDPALCVRRFEPRVTLPFAILRCPGEATPRVAEMIGLIDEEIAAMQRTSPGNPVFQVARL